MTTTTPSSQHHIMLIAGEVSGDTHGAELVRAIRKRDPAASFSGLGGSFMQDQGVELIEDLTRLAVIGLCDVFKHFGEIRRIFYQFLEEVDRRQPDCVILIDYPGFNLRMARALKKRGIKVIYYISPQVWAWRSGRVNTIKKTVDRMLVMFEFEQAFYKQFSMAADFVGHPLVDNVRVTRSRHDLLAGLGLDPSTQTIGIVPGSREKEIVRLLPPMLEAARIIQTQLNNNVHFLLPRSGSISAGLIAEYLAAYPDLKIHLVDQDFYNTVNACDACLVTSGTATLETALLEKPMVIVYKTTPLTYFLARRLIKIRHIGLVNIVAQKDIVPECIQNEANGRTIAARLLGIVKDPLKMETIINDLKNVRHKLGECGASDNAAQIVVEEISEENLQQTANI
ncbi:MAG: lipid-A-disaccharide synthase [Candidatus Omnitrophota bacterium]